VWVQGSPTARCERPGRERDENGKPTGKEYRLGPNDDAQKIAGRLAREAWIKATGTSDFNRSLNYQPIGIS
jgi:hypothetical protein